MNTEETAKQLGEAMVAPIMELLEPTLKIRCVQIAEAILDAVEKKYAAGEPSASPQINTATESCGGVPSFFKDIIRKLEFSANQCELWEEPEDASIVSCEYRSLSDKLKKWIEQHG